MLKLILPKIIFYVLLFFCVHWYWQGSNEGTRTGLFYFVFSIAFFQNAYYSYKLSKNESTKKSP